VEATTASVHSGTHSDLVRALPISSTENGEPQTLLEDQLKVLSRTVAALKAEQARDHEALRLLAAGWTRQSRENAEWSNETEHLRARLDSLEERLERTTLVLPGARGSPPPLSSQAHQVHEVRWRGPAIPTLEQMGAGIVHLLGVSTSSPALQRTRMTTALLAAIAASLLGITVRLLSG